MNKYQSILTIAKKEIWSFLNTSLFYVIVIPFLLLSTFLYFRSVLVVNEASLRPYFEILPWFLLFLASALTMKIISDDYKNRTIELLNAHPIPFWQLILGKFLGVLSIYVLILISTFSLPLTILTYSSADIGIILAQYLGAFFLGATFLAIGTATSAFFKNSTASFLTSSAISFGLILIGLDMVILALPWPLNQVVSEIAIMPHIQSISRGALDIRDLVYFISLTSLFLLAGVFKLSREIILENKQEKQKLIYAFGLTLAIAIALNFLLLSYPLRLDFTSNKLFTLSAGSKQTIKNLPDLVTIKIYASQNLPAPMQLTLKSLEDLLKDYQKINDKLVVKRLYPDTDQSVEQEAQSLGIQEVTFNKVAAKSFEVKTGFLGVSISYGDKNEVIPFIQDTNNLEYQLTKRIRKLVAKNPEIIGLYNNDSTGQYQAFRETLSTEYQVQPISLNTDTGLDDLKTLVVIYNPDVNTATAAGVLKKYLNKDSSQTIILTKGVNIDTQLLNVTTNDSPLSQTLDEVFGLQINKDLVYDPPYGQPIVLGGQDSRYILPYPFWFSVILDESVIPSNGVKNLLLGWPSSLSWQEKEGISVKKFMASSPQGKKQTSNFKISPQQIANLDQSGGESIPLGVLVKKGNSKTVVIGDYNIVSDQFIQNNPQNLSLFANLVDWLAADNDLSAIPNKINSRAVFRFNNPIEPIIIQYANLLMPSILLAVFALIWLSRRKKLTSRELKKYE